MAPPGDGRGAVTRTRPAVGRHSAVRGGECRRTPRIISPASSRIPRSCAAFVTSWHDVGATLRDAWRRSAGRLGFFAGDRHASRSSTSVRRRCHGQLVNLPTRAVVGTRWSGREHCWRHAPRDYGAIHFHDDDLGDCGWQADFTWTVPDDLRSGAYALHLTCDAGEDWLPFYVLPRRQGPFAPIAFLASTFTYQAYANHARSSIDQAYYDRVAAWGAYPYNPNRLSDLRPLDLQQASRRQRHLVLVAPSADPDDAAGVPHLQRSARLRPAALSGRSASAGLAGGEGLRLRHRHRRGPGR